jgi:hypothetical protein
LVVVVLVAATPNYLRQASPDRGKYILVRLFYFLFQKLRQHRSKQKASEVRSK